MKIKRSFLCTSIGAVIVLFAGCCLSHQQTRPLMPAAEATPPRPLSSDEQDQLVLFYGAGLKGDRTKIPLLIAALRDQNMHPYLTEADLYALARLKAIEAIPSLNTLVQTVNDGEIGSSATVVKARLLAEGGPKSGLATITILHRFYLQLELSPQDLNESVAKLGLPPGGTAYPTREVCALREAADIVYRSPAASLTASLAASPEVRAVNYSADFPSALKMRLAYLSPEERVKTLVQELSQARVISENERLKQQLLVEYGTLASDAAASKLKDMLSHRQQYSPEEFELLLGILDVAADKKQLALAKQFCQDSNPEIASYARAVCLPSYHGAPEPFVADY